MRRPSSPKPSPTRSACARCSMQRWSGARALASCRSACLHTFTNYAMRSTTPSAQARRVGMGERLTDTEIEGLQRFVVGDDGPRPIHIVWTDRALVELRERRAADLTPAEREALEFAKHCVEHSLNQLRMS